MKVAVVWEGEMGRETSLALQEWLPEVLPNLNPVGVGSGLSPHPVEWLELVQQVDPSDPIIFCVTAETIALPETLFQVGVLAGRKAGVPLYPFFVGIDGAAVPRLLSVLFRCVFPERESVLGLVKDLNSRSGLGMPEAILLGLFSAKWPPLESTLNRIALPPKNTAVSHPSEQQPVPKHALSDQARELLVEAAVDRNGRVLSLATLTGRHLETNQKEFIEQGNPRSEARWLAALRELVGEGFLEPRGTKGEVFVVTADGYRVADGLRRLRK
jgi:hypothetical protein